MRRREFFKTVLVGAMAAVLRPNTAVGARISVEEGDPGYDPHWLTFEGEILITCDGKHIECAITADSREGYVKYYDMDLNRVVREKYGRVEIKINGSRYDERF